MLTRIRQLLAPPIFEGDDDKTRAATLLNAALWVTLGAMAISIIGTLFMSSGYVLIVRLVTSILVGGAAIVSLILMRLGKVRTASLLLVGALYLMLTLVIISTGGGTFSTFVVLVAVAGLVLGRRPGIVVTVLIILTGLALVAAGEAGLLPDVPIGLTQLAMWVINSVAFAVVAVLLYVALGDVDTILARSREYAAELELQRGRLEDVIEERTQSLARRTRYLEATAHIARDATSILDTQVLLTRVVDLIRDEFGLHRMGIFLMDPATQSAVLRAVSGMGGQQLVERGFRLDLRGAGIVPHVIRTGQPYLAPDVTEDPLYLDDPDLGDTRSEMTLPLRARDEVLGALSVQSATPDAFDDEVLAVMMTMADQVAMAISNARLFQQTQEGLDAERRAYSEQSQAAWRELLRDRPHIGFRRDSQGVSMAGELWRPEMERAVHTGQRALGGDDGKNLAIPITAGGQVIGVIDAQRPGDSGEWTDDEIELVEALTEQLGVVLEGARLYGDTQRRAAEERLVGEITARLRETLDVKTVVETAADEIYRNLGLDRVIIRLATEENGESARVLV